MLELLSSKENRLIAIQYFMLSMSSKKRLLQDLKGSEKNKFLKVINELPKKIISIVEKMSYQEYRNIATHKNIMNEYESNHTKETPDFLDLLKINSKVTPATKKLMSEVAESTLMVVR